MKCVKEEMRETGRGDSACMADTWRRVMSVIDYGRVKWKNTWNLCQEQKSEYDFGTISRTTGIVGCNF